MDPLNHGLIYQTEIPVSELTGWLEDNCRGDWTVEVEQTNPGPDDVSLIIQFEKSADKRIFLADFA